MPRTELGGAGREDDMSVTFRLDGVDDELRAIVGRDHPIDDLWRAARLSFGVHSATRQQTEETGQGQAADGGAGAGGGGWVAGAVLG